MSASSLFFEALFIRFLSFVLSLSGALHSSWIPILRWAAKSNRSLRLLIRRFFGFCPGALKASADRALNVQRDERNLRHTLLLIAIVSINYRMMNQ